MKIYIRFLLSISTIQALNTMMLAIPPAKKKGEYCGAGRLSIAFNEIKPEQSAITFVKRIWLSNMNAATKSENALVA